MRQAGLFGLSDHMKRLWADGDPLDVLARVVDFEAFRLTLVSALAYFDGAKGGRPPYDPVMMLKILVLAAQNNVADAHSTLKFAKARPTADGRPQLDIAILSFGYKSSISICRVFGSIRKGKAIDGARYDGRMLRDVVSEDNTVSDVRLPQPEQRTLGEGRWPGQPHTPEKAQGAADAGPYPEGQRLPVQSPRPGRACVRASEGEDGLFIRTIGIARAQAKNVLALVSARRRSAGGV